MSESLIVSGCFEGGTVIVNDINNPLFGVDNEFDKLAKGLTDKVTSYLDGMTIIDWRTPEVLKVLNMSDPEKARTYFDRGLSMEAAPNAAEKFRAAAKSDYAELSDIRDYIDRMNYKAKKAVERLEKAIEGKNPDDVYNVMRMIDHLKDLTSDPCNTRLSNIKGYQSNVSNTIQEHENNWTEDAKLNRTINEALADFKGNEFKNVSSLKQYDRFKNTTINRAVKAAYERVAANSSEAEMEGAKQSADRLRKDFVKYQAEVKSTYQTLAKLVKPKKDSREFTNMLNAAKKIAEQNIDASSMTALRQDYAALRRASVAYTNLHKKDFFKSDRVNAANALADKSLQVFRSAKMDGSFNADDTFENQVQGLKVEIGNGQHVTVKSVKEADGFVFVENGPKPLGLNGLVREERNANPAFKDPDQPIIGGKGGKKSGSANPEIKGKGNVMQ